jgi:hypothetical protein
MTAFKTSTERVFFAFCLLGSLALRFALFDFESGD